MKRCFEKYPITRLIMNKMSREHALLWREMLTWLKILPENLVLYARICSSFSCKSSKKNQQSFDNCQNNIGISEKHKAAIYTHSIIFLLRPINLIGKYLKDNWWDISYIAQLDSLI